MEGRSCGPRGILNATPGGSLEEARTSTTTYVVQGGALDSWLAERRRLGQDGRDEVWDGVYHVVPHAHSSHGALAHRLSLALAGHASAAGLTTLGEFNLGTDEHDFRVPGMGWTSTPIEDLTLYLPTVEVVEFESPGDETWEKVPFHFARGAGEVWVITRTAGVSRCSRVPAAPPVTARCWTSPSTGSRRRWAGRDDDAGPRACPLGALRGSGTTHCMTNCVR
ncbi:PDDEXK family nuclease [Kineococcus sp. SYSU DK003]|uniref:hypothetical protein n=1 Tax=Kineococcus sp. SYSU DK003 TaxID=3383124 RepID=UPI003D7D8E4E